MRLSSATKKILGEGFTPFKVRAQGAAAIKDGLLQTGFTPFEARRPKAAEAVPLAGRSQTGFTLMELIVATTIFAVFSVAVTSLFNYDFRIMRRTEALRQATQGMRNFTDFIGAGFGKPQVAVRTGGNADWISGVSGNNILRNAARRRRYFTDFI